MILVTQDERFRSNAVSTSQDGLAVPMFSVRITREDYLSLGHECGRLLRRLLAQVIGSQNRLFSVRPSQMRAADHPLTLRTAHKTIHQPIDAVPLSLKPLLHNTVIPLGHPVNELRRMAQPHQGTALKVVSWTRNGGLLFGESFWLGDRA